MGLRPDERRSIARGVNIEMNICIFPSVLQLFFPQKINVFIIHNKDVNETYRGPSLCIVKVSRPV